jgi:hypothetical protein
MGPEPGENADLVRTRKALHRVAEHVLAAARKRATGQITLEPGPGGFRTPPLDDGRILAVEGAELVVHPGDGRDPRRAPITTVRAGAELAGTEPGFPWTKHPPETPYEPDVPLEVDPAAARLLADWFALGAEALARLSAEAADDDPSPAQIFPEHFDLGVTADDVNYGVSPGDDEHPRPYLYVGPHEGPPAADHFWNAPFGAMVDQAAVASVEDATAFFRAGRERVRAARSG